MKLAKHEYSPTRAGSVPLELFETFEGTLQVDGYPGYNAVFRKYAIQQLACMAHIRRKFYEAFIVGGKKPGLANDALVLIRDLFHFEKEWENTSVDERLTLRQELASSKMQELEQWLISNKHKVPPRSQLGSAFSYAIAQWRSMQNYLKDGRFQISNNWIENLIRPLAIGRKNWLFSDSAKGAEASAIYFTLTRSAILNGLNPLEYFTTCLERLSAHPLTSDLVSSMMPHEFCHI